MMNQFSTYYHFLKDVKRLKEDIGLGLEGNRNVHWALGDFGKIVEENAKTVDSELKIVIVVTNGQFTNTQAEDLNLQLLKKQNEQKNILVFIVALGSKVSICQLERTTLNSRIIVVHYLNQLVFGGKASFRLISPPDQKDQLISMGGVLSVLQRKFMDAAKLLEPSKGEITYFKGGYVGWSSDEKYKNLIPLQFSIPPSETPTGDNPTGDTGEIPSSNAPTAENSLQPEDLSKSGLGDIIKRQRIPGISRLRRPTIRRPRISRPTIRRPTLSRASLRSPTGGVDLNTLARRWLWTKIFPSIRKGIIKKANVIVMVDVLGSDLINIMQKLVHYTTIPFTYTLGQTSIYGMTSVRLVEYCQRRTFARSEDIQRLVTTIASAKGRTFSIAQHVLQLMKSPQILSLKMNNIMIMILTHRTFDFAQYRYIGKVLQVAGIKLYILGLGLESERAYYSELTTPNRVFTSLSVQSFFTNQMFSSFIRQLRIDVGASERVTNLDIVSSRVSSVLGQLRRAGSAARSAGRRASRRMSSSRSTRRSGGRSGGRSSSRSTRRSSRRTGRSRRIIRPRQNLIRRIMRRVRRRRSKKSDIPRIYKRDAPIDKNSNRDSEKGPELPKRSEIDFEEQIDDPKDVSLETKSEIPLEDSEYQPEEIKEKRNRVSRFFDRFRRKRKSPSRTSSRRPSGPSRTASRRPASSSRASRPSRVSRPLRASRPAIRRPNPLRSLRRAAAGAPSPRNSTIGRNLRIISRMLSSDGAVGPINLVVLVDGTFGTSITKVREFLRDYLLIFQREGSYVTLASFGSSTHLHTLSTQFSNAGQIAAAVNRIKGLRTRSRSTGQALMAARRWFSSYTPDYPFVVLALLNGPSSDDYRVPASMLAKDGIKVISIGNGRSVGDDELLGIQSSAKLSFRTTFNDVPRVITSLLPLFKAICGSRKRSPSQEGKNFSKKLF